MKALLASMLKATTIPRPPQHTAFACATTRREQREREREEKEKQRSISRKRWVVFNKHRSFGHVGHVGHVEHVEQSSKLNRGDTIDVLGTVVIDVTHEASWCATYTEKHREHTLWYNTQGGRYKRPGDGRSRERKRARDGTFARGRSVAPITECGAQRPRNGTATATSVPWRRGI
jgi:hypothetical protein